MKHNLTKQICGPFAKNKTNPFMITNMQNIGLAYTCTCKEILSDKCGTLLLFLINLKFIG